MITHLNVPHAAACATAEGGRQQSIAAAIAAGGGSAAIQLAVKNGDIAYYRALVASAKINGQPYAEFLATLTRLGADIA